jgi:hypothetical protein
MTVPVQLDLLDLLAVNPRADEHRGERPPPALSANEHRQVRAGGTIVRFTRRRTSPRLYPDDPVPFDDDIGF